MRHSALSGCGSPLHPPGPVAAAPRVRAVPDQIDCLAPSSRAHCWRRRSFGPGHPVNGNIPLLGAAASPARRRPMPRPAPAPRWLSSILVVEAAVFETREFELILIRRNPGLRNAIEPLNRTGRIRGDAAGG